jgi:hypothetical protein
MTMPLVVVASLALLALQPTSRMDALVAAVRPALPFPAATEAGDLPADNSDASRWFVVWPRSADDTAIILRANPLHPDVQKMGAAAMEEINVAVTAAERRAQAAYDRALEQLRRTGRAGELENVSLDDEGVAGERIDAELEVMIELATADTFEISSGQPPVVRPGANGPSWIVAIPANTYRPNSGDDRREHFRAAETHLYFGMASSPTVTRVGDQPRYRVAAAPDANGFAVVIKGHAGMVETITAGADWTRLAPR